MPTVGDLLDAAEDEIRSSRNVDLWRPSDARVNAEELMNEVLGEQVTNDHLDNTLGSAVTAKYRAMVKRRVGGEPVALILGKTEFRNLELRVRKGVFVPRNSSELLAEEAVKRLKRRTRPVAVDVATGIGPVAMAIANEVKGARVWGLDIWEPSIKVARSNAERLGIRNVNFLKSDMLAKLPAELEASVDAFTIHPPYVARRQVKTLPHEIRNFEPEVSLSDQSVDGLGLVRRLAEESTPWLRKGGWLLVEVSPDLSRSVGGIMRRGGFRDVRSVRDSLGATRVISGRK